MKEKQNFDAGSVFGADERARRWPAHTLARRCGELGEAPYPAALSFQEHLRRWAPPVPTQASIEIALGGIVVRVRGEADPRAPTTVLKVLRVRP